MSESLEAWNYGIITQLLNMVMNPLDHFRQYGGHRFHPKVLSSGMSGVLFFPILIFCLGKTRILHSAPGV